MAKQTPFTGPFTPTEADLAQCVHCGLCLQHCPTFVATGLETESPRGRLYLIKAMAEGLVEPTPNAIGHLDMCLQCRNCEAVCPSGVPYGRIMEGARARSPREQPLAALLAPPRSLPARSDRASRPSVADGVRPPRSTALPASAPSPNASRSSETARSSRRRSPASRSPDAASSQARGRDQGPRGPAHRLHHAARLRSRPPRDRPRPRPQRLRGRRAAGTRSAAEPCTRTTATSRQRCGSRGATSTPFWPRTWTP